MFNKTGKLISPSPLQENEVQVWYAFAEKFCSVPNQYMEIFSQEERLRYQEIHLEKDKQEFLAAHYITRKILSLYLPEISPDRWAYAFNQYGKPMLANKQSPPWLHFNISHSGGLVVCAVSGNPQLGIDVEVTDRAACYLGIAESTFSEDEKYNMNFFSSEQKKDYFYKIWTLKEAYIKAKGMGLAIPLDRLTFLLKDGIVLSFFDDDAESNQQSWKFHLMKLAPQYQAAIALQTSKDILVTEKFFDSF